MTSGDQSEPRIVMATDASGVVEIDAMVARRRAIVARLTLGARTARQRLERAERDATADGVGGVPDDLLAVVDAMLDKAVRASDGALEEARAEAEATVADALVEATGGEATNGRHLEPGEQPRRRSLVGLDHHVTPPPSAADLWRSLRGDGRGAPMALVAPKAPPAAPLGHASVSDLHALPPSSLPALSDLGGDALDPVRDDAPVGTLVLEPPSEEWLATESSDAFDSFWQEARNERRVRDRLRRRSPKEDS